jgi:drug/metabolite transporter (DMT)-like permease
VSVALGEHWGLPTSPRVWWAWLYLVLFGSVVAFSAYRFVVERVSSTLASTYAYVNPPVALFVGWWLGNESFSTNTLVGLPIVLGAVALLAWVQARSHGVAAPSPAARMTIGNSAPVAAHEGGLGGGNSNL